MEKVINHRKLPPLKTLSGFEATARLLSFRKAAQELNLEPSGDQPSGTFTGNKSWG